MCANDDLAERAELYAVLITALTAIESPKRMKMLIAVLREDCETERLVRRLWHEVRQGDRVRIIGERE